MDFHQVTAIDVCVNLRGRYICVAEHLLNSDQISASLEKVRREGVPKGVRTHVPFDLRRLDV